eukprot:4813498-Amphidinium_carterae.1
MSTTSTIFHAGGMRVWEATDLSFLIMIATIDYPKRSGVSSGPSALFNVLSLDAGGLIGVQRTRSCSACFAMFLQCFEASGASAAHVRD